MGFDSGSDDAGVAAIWDPSSMMNAAVRNSGRAPLIARSFTMPLNASRPMSPPGKNNVVTTKKSVVSAMRAAPTSSTAWSSKSGLETQIDFADDNWDDARPKKKLSLDANFRNLEIGRLLRCSVQMDAVPIAKFHDLGSNLFSTSW